MVGQNQTGIERYYRNLIKNFDNKSRKDKFIIYFAAENINPITLNRSRTLLKYFPFSNNGLFRILFGFSFAIKKFKPDIIHASNFSPIIKTIPTITTVHDLCFKSYPKTYSLKSRLAFNIFFERSLNSSDAIICVSKTVKKQLVKYYPEVKDKAFVIYEAGDDFFKFLPNKIKVTAYLKNRFGIKSKYFLVVGDIRERKNPLPIIEAFSILLKDNPNLQLVFAGKNKMEKVIKLKFNYLIVSGHLQFLGYVSDEDLNHLYNGALSLIFNSVCEGFGLPILEAMSCKTPVICNDIEVFREIASNSAIFAKNKTQLYMAMKKITLDENFRKKYSQLGHQRSRFFSWQKTAKETFRVCNQIISKS
jgi:glycosyltransferase involved in cell wall biosynthesis